MPRYKIMNGRSGYFVWDTVVQDRVPNTADWRIERVLAETMRLNKSLVERANDLLETVVPWLR